METEPEELQFLGFAGICRESHNLIVGHRRLFSQIALALILPLSVLFLLHIQISDLIFSKIDRNVEALEKTPDGSVAEDTIVSKLASEWASFVLFKAVYVVFVLVFSLLSTSAVVYAIACVYSVKDMSFGKIMTVVPKVWKRLMVTFLWSFSILFLYNLAFIFVIVIVLLLLGTGPVGIMFAIVILVVYFSGLVYISIVWHLASVVTVLEDSYGIAAMQKSKNLIKGKEWLVAAIFLMFQLLMVAVELGFKKIVVKGSQLELGAGIRLVFAGTILSAMIVVVLLALVMQTVVYFVCKSYHHENIDKSSLSDHLGVYLGEYEPLKERDVQLEQFQV